MNFLGVALWIIYLSLALVLPIVTASRFLYLRKRSLAWSIGVAVVSIVAGGAGFWAALVVAAQLVPPGHDLIFDTGKMVAGLLAGFLLGFPAGTWGGAWGTAGLVNRHR